MKNKVGDRFESKTGIIYEIISFSKNPSIITYSVIIGKRKDIRTGSLSEVTKYNQI